MSVEWLSHPAFSLSATIGAFWLGDSLYRKSGRALWAHPFAIAFLLLILMLNILPLTYHDYRDQTALLQLLLGTATIALAVPVYLHRERIRRVFWPLLATLSLGSLLTVGLSVAIAHAFGLGRDVLLSMATKSITTPIAVALHDDWNASPSLAAAFIMVTGLLGAMVGGQIMTSVKCSDAAGRGITYGLTAHAVGTARALEESQETGAFSALAMGINGIVTALLLPFIIRALG